MAYGRLSLMSELRPADVDSDGNLAVVPAPEVLWNPAASDGAHTCRNYMWWSHRLHAFVRGSTFDYISVSLVLLNAISLGIQTDWQARNVTGDTTTGFRVVDGLFCVLFTTELLLKMWSYRCEFFQMPNLGWNAFDTVLVTSQLVDEMTALVVVDKSVTSGTPNLSIMRMLRILRLIRVMRLMRVLRLIGELRTLVMSIMASLKSLVWAMLLLFLIVYVLGVYLTQLVLDARLDESGQAKANVSDALVEYYGSLGDTIVTLYQAVTGGQNWGDLVTPLRDDVSGFLVPFFMFYIAFAMFCIMNVVTSVFVESAMVTAKRDKESYMMHHVKAVFAASDLDHSGTICYDEFEKALKTREMQEVFVHLDLDIGEARGLFHLLDVDGTGAVDCEEFITGCHRLRGAAKAIDLTLLARQVSEMFEHITTHSSMVQDQLVEMGKMLSS